jgi:hypothetical protein
MRRIMFNSESETFMSYGKTFSILTLACCVLFATPVREAAAQTMYGWGHPTQFTPAASNYGMGYVGTPGYAPAANYYAPAASGYVPATSYYRAPQVGRYGYSAPVTTYYAPATNYYTPAPTNFLSAGSAVANTSYYAPVGNYPAQTVLPTNFTAAAPYYANYPTNYAANYATPAFYRTHYARTPVTYYRPVLVADPYSGTTTTVLQPAQGYEWQTRRQQTYRLFPLFNRNPQPAYGWSPNGSCSSGYCGATPTASPYYAPANVAPALPAGTYPSTTYPSASQPFTVSPSTSGGVFPSGPTTIAPPSTFTPGTYSPGTSLPSSGSTIVNPGTVVNPGSAVPPASVRPSLDAGEFRSGPSRSDYPPPYESYVVPQVKSDVKLLSPPALNPSLNTTDEPADRIPSLFAPQNGNTETAKPQATIRRDWSIIPDPESTRGVDAKPQTNKAPSLLRTDDRTAFSSQGVKAYREASYVEQRETATPTKSYKVFGDDAWKPAAR